jgi:hypothetical protein
LRRSAAALARGRLGRYAARLLATILVAAYLWRFWHLALTNANFPWHLRGGGPSAGPLAALLSCGAAVLCVLAFARLARASRPAFVVALVAAGSLGWLLYPVGCDSHESFLDRPNKTCRCIGATMSYYPEGVYDGTGVEYCIGLEGALARPRSRPRSHPRRALARGLRATPT